MPKASRVQDVKLLGLLINARISKRKTSCNDRCFTHGATSLSVVFGFKKALRLVFTIVKQFADTLLERNFCAIGIFRQRLS